MTPTNAYIRDWLIRVNTQYDVETPEKIKNCDHARAKQDLGINNFFYSSPQPAYTGVNIGNSRTTNNTYHTTNNTYNTSRRSSSSSEAEEISDKKGVKKKQEKPNWGVIAAVGVVSTAVVGISVFAYARLSKAAEGTKNYLEHTKNIQKWAGYSACLDSSHEKLFRVAKIQSKIDKNAVDKIEGYKNVVLAGAVGTIAAAAGIIAMPWFAVAGTTAAVAGLTIDALTTIYAGYNCGIHWSDEKEGKKEFNKVKQDIPGLMNTLFSTNENSRSYPVFESFSTSPSAPPSESDHDLPPSYDQVLAAIRKQRENPNIVYPNLDPSFFMGERTKY
ncbi:MAG: hypothetical protein ACRCU0_05335 [Candidatus Rhabdochlamydia sp.]